MRTVLILAVFISLSFGGDESLFAPFGAANGDTVAPPSDDGYWGPIAFDFPFYGVTQTSLYVDNNGIITFEDGISEFTPTGMSGAYFPAIAPYWADVYTDCGTGTVSYRQSTDAALLATWSAQVPSSFNGVRMFIVTWNNVGYFAACDKADSFQAILITDGVNSWVFFNYGTMQWTTGSASGGFDGLGGVPASVGFSSGDGVQYVQTSASLTGDVINTQNFVTLVSGSTVVIAPPPAQTCGNGIVEGTEQCDGGACCSLVCTFQSSSFTCGTQSGTCDVAATCSGSSASCPANTFLSSTTVCRASAGVCDVAETCTGSSSSCPADSFDAAGTVCRASAGSCDVAETCSGSAASCPSDSFEPSTYTCRPAVNSCDIAEMCTGSSVACPADQVKETASCFCARQNLASGAMGYYCDQTTGFYQCLGGVFASQSRDMACAAGTHCGCGFGVECSCGETKSPCVTVSTAQQC